MKVACEQTRRARPRGEINRPPWQHRSLPATRIPIIRDASMDLAVGSWATTSRPSTGYSAPKRFIRKASRVPVYRYSNVRVVEDIGIWRRGLHETTSSNYSDSYVKRTHETL